MKSAPRDASSMGWQIARSAEADKFPTHHQDELSENASPLRGKTEVPREEELALSCVLLGVFEHPGIDQLFELGFFRLLDRFEEAAAEKFFVSDRPFAGEFDDTEIIRVGANRELESAVLVRSRAARQPQVFAGTSATPAEFAVHRFVAKSGEIIGQAFDAGFDVFRE